VETNYGGATGFKRFVKSVHHGTDQAISASFDRPGGAACNARVRLVELGA
jgi:hypothetical protein